MTISHNTATRLFIAALVIYVIGAFLSYGWRYNRPEPCPHSLEHSCAVKRNVDAMFEGMFWPLIAPRDAAIWVTKP